MEYNRSAMKEEVKQSMRGARPNAMLLTLVYLAITFVLGLAVQGLRSILIGGESVAALTQMLMRNPPATMDELMGLISVLAGYAGGLVSIGALAGLLSTVVNWTLQYGYKGYCLSMVRGEESSYGRLLCAFPKWGWVLLNGLLGGIFSALWSLLFSLGGAAVTAMMLLWVKGSMGITLSIVAWLAVAVLSVGFSLRYVLADYVLLDEGVDSLQALRRSKELMRGRKWQLFVLEISFIGWYLLVALIGSVVSGIGLLVTTGVSGLVSENVAGALGGMTAGGIVTTILVWLFTMPLSLWLSPYIGGSTARFYDIARIQDGGAPAGESAPRDDGSWSSADWQ